MKKLFFVVALFSAIASYAQEPNAYKWGVEVELIEPFIPDVHIWQIQTTRMLFTTAQNNHADVVLGAYLRPNVKHDVVEEIDEYMLLVAYRHYLWKGLHIEPGINMGYYWGWNNLIDGKDYQGVGIFWEANIGYKVNVGKNDRFYGIFQAGGLGNIHAWIGPRGGKPDNFLNANCLIGINL